jgi:hypothetical protein
VLPPVQNALSPTPVNTTQFTSRALLAARNARITPLTMSVVYELNWPGLSSQIQALYSPSAILPSGVRAGRFSKRTPGLLMSSTRS